MGYKVVPVIIGTRLLCIVAPVQTLTHWAHDKCDKELQKTFWNGFICEWKCSNPRSIVNEMFLYVWMRIYGLWMKLCWSMSVSLYWELLPSSHWRSQPTIKRPCHVVKSLQLIWRWGINRWNPWASIFKWVAMTWLLVPVMAARVTSSLTCPID